jgi:putative oxygen-independent coproporphyrinogen III oxidase
LQKWLAAALVDDWKRAGFGLYVHWPFCEAKCPYCDFNSHVVKNIDHDAWLNAYLLEMDRIHEQTQNRTLSSIFFGGGTPSLMTPKTIEAIIARAHRLWGFANNIEITLEANPSSVEAQKFRDFRVAGVNRVSLGVQSLIDDDLRALGRLHSAKEAFTAIDIAMNEFDRMSFDLIYGRQNQDLNQWEAELTQAISLGSTHLSLYHLTIEAGTAFGDRFDRGKLRGLPTEDLSATMFQTTQAITNKAGFVAYEVSNHAKNDEMSLHNHIYWDYGDYIGIGPGAHGRIGKTDGKFATETPLQPGSWLKTATSKSIGSWSWTKLSDYDQAVEMVMMGLRTSHGIDTDVVEDRSSGCLNHTAIAEMTDMGLLAHTETRLSATEEGRLLLNQIIEKCLNSNT